MDMAISVGRGRFLVEVFDGFQQRGEVVNRCMVDERASRGELNVGARHAFAQAIDTLNLQVPLAMADFLFQAVCQCQAPALPARGLLWVVSDVNADHHFFHANQPRKKLSLTDCRGPYDIGDVVRQ
jgi:hypothetical protein